MMARRKQMALDIAGIDTPAVPAGPVTCLGIEFPDDDARRAHFTARLREYLGDPSFRATPGFPVGTIEDILRMSDPPYYTVCPNPFLAEFTQVHGTPYDDEAEAASPYRREPLAIDTSVGKTDHLYQAHGYHTKVPHLAIVPSILHYTRPGDIVLDGFAGSGMTGVAAQWCGAAPAEYRASIEAERKEQGLPAPEWGARRAILNDLGPAATFIGAGFNLPFDLQRFAREARRILGEVDAEIGWMYETLHTDGETKGRINYTVWSEVFRCPACGKEVIFTEAALDLVTKRVRDAITCDGCGAMYKSKEDMTLVMETFVDPANGEVATRPKRTPCLINYSIGSVVHEKLPDIGDTALIDRIVTSVAPSGVPTSRFTDSHLYRSRMATAKVGAVHHLYLPRQAHALTAIWNRVDRVADQSTRRMLLWLAEQAIWGLSVLARYVPTHFSQVNSHQPGVYYVPSQISECSPWYNLENRLGRLIRLAFAKQYTTPGTAMVATGDCAHLGLPDESADYIFTDPPFGENFQYADLNFLVESWHRVTTQKDTEAIVARVRSGERVNRNPLHEYQSLMGACFAEYFRVLKPGRWMTVVFSNSSNAVWRAIQEALGSAGFVVADVRTLDKQQMSYRQVTSSAVKQDLVISSYKPTGQLAKTFELGNPGPVSAWAFVDEHLRNTPVFVGRRREGKDEAGNATIVHETDIQVERTGARLFDRMVAFHVQRRLSVPLDSGGFRAGLAVRYVERDGMYFIPTQVTIYDHKRVPETRIQLLSFSPVDEQSSINWVRQQLATKPQRFHDIQPTFMREEAVWSRHEKTIDLRRLLEENFVQYDGTGEVPSQIHAYLSSNYHTLRNLSKTDPALVTEAKDRWYVPDPGKQADLDQIRTRALLREFDTYRDMKPSQLKAVRTDAVRAGFARAYKEGDYATIVTIGERLPQLVIKEDEFLVMYYDNAVTRTTG